MFESLSQRTVIIGNSGPGKSALAESLAASIHVLVIDLDLLNWERSSARVRWGRRRGSHAAAANPSRCVQRGSGIVNGALIESRPYRE
jgi:adenylate kinase family enzyme